MEQPRSPIPIKTDRLITSEFDGYQNTNKYFNDDYELELALHMSIQDKLENNQKEESMIKEIVPKTTTPPNSPILDSSKSNRNIKCSIINPVIKLPNVPLPIVKQSYTEPQLTLDQLRVKRLERFT